MSHVLFAGNREVQQPKHGTTRTSLSAGKRDLLRVLQFVRYGRVYSVPIHSGEPVIGPGVRWKRLLKVFGDNGPHPAANAIDYVLKREVCEFFRLLAEVGNGMVTAIDVRNGLPTSFELAEEWPI